MTAAADLPLAGVRVVELVGIGPGPFAGMLLADLGAEVVALRRPGPSMPDGGLWRGRPMVAADLKDPSVRDAVLAAVERADVMVEGFRPGVAERLGLGPADCQARNPRLVYGRITGWGQTGPLADRAGHDLNYIAVTGALHHAARRGSAPVPPANLLGDFGGGGLYLVTMLLAALLQRERTGRGAVLDVAIVDGTAYLASMLYGLRATGLWTDEAGTNLLDTGAPYYDVYPCSDGGYVALGALEPPFFAALVELLGLDPAWVARRDDPATWPKLRETIAAVLFTRSRDDWAAAARATDACLAPVLSLAEAPGDPQLAARGVLAEGMPRLPWPPAASDPVPSAAERLVGWGVGDDAVATLVGS